MASATSANVRIISAWREGSPAGKRQSVKRVELYNGTFGGASNTIPASAFGLRVIEECSVVQNNKAAGAALALAVPLPDGSALRLHLPTAAAAAADIVIETTPNGLYFTIRGYE